MILTSQIDLGIRARSTLSGIPELAEDIRDRGLISPILLTKKSPELVSEYEAFHQIRLNPNSPYLLTCGGRRLAALTQLGIHILYPGVSCDINHAGCVTREDTGLLDLLLIEGRENRNRQDLDWRDDMKLIVSAFRLARQQANSEGEYLVMKDFATLLGVSHTHLSIAERLYDDYVSDPASYESAKSIYEALTFSLKKTGSTAAKILLHRQLNAKPIIQEVKPKGGDIHECHIPANISQGRFDLGTAEVQSPAVPISLSTAFFQTWPYQFMPQQTSGFCDHIVTQAELDIDKEEFISLAWNALPEHGYLAIFVRYLESWSAAIRASKFKLQRHPLIWNKIDYRFPPQNFDYEEFAPSYETCLLARKPGSRLAQAQNSAIYTCSHLAKEETFGKGYIPPEVFSWVIRAIAVPGQVIYDPFARTGASTIGTLNVKCRPIGTESDEERYKSLIKNLKSYYTKQLPNVQFL